MTNYWKLFLIGALALVVGTLSVASALADPYDGVNRIGTYYQQTNTWQNPYAGSVYNGLRSPEYTVADGAGYGYDYIAPPRAGGWFGSTTGWLVGLRSPQYTNVAPTHYTTYYRSTPTATNWYNGGYGYPQMTASAYPQYYSRYSGVYGY
jgi:hypothetical protein